VFQVTDEIEFTGNIDYYVSHDHPQQNEHSHYNGGPMRFLLPLLFLAATASAQFPNGGFERWTIPGVPDSCSVNNIPTLYSPCTMSNTAYKGAHALKGAAVAFATVAMGPVYGAGYGGQGVPVTGKPASFQGYYQFSSQGGDEFAVSVLVHKGGATGTLIGGGAVEIPGSVSTYTKFSIPIDYYTSDTPDQASVMITMTNASGTLHVGSYYLIDELSFASSGTAVRNDVQLPETFALQQNYPNPFNPSTTIAYSIPSSGRVQLKVFDRLGMEIATLLDRTEAAGQHTVSFSAAGLSSGVYFVSLNHGGQHAVRPMLLLK
jgi:hypothetical protein